MVRIAALLLGATLLSASDQDGTVGVNALPVYNENAKDKQGPAVVVDVMEGTPAAKAGIRNGDFIVAMNGADVEGKSAFEALRINLTGSIGGRVKLTVWREAEGRQFEADLTRVAYPLRRNPDGDPFRFYRPANWRPEVDPFPLPWSPQLSYRGWEDLVFAPGFEDASSPNYHSYAFVWWLDGKQEFSADRLQADLLAYYKGISEQRGRTRNFTPDLSRVSVRWTPEVPDRGRNGVRTFHGDAVFYNPAGALFTLHGEASVRWCGANHTAGVFILSPQESSAPIWKDLAAIRDSFQCDK